MRIYWIFFKDMFKLFGMTRRGEYYLQNATMISMMLQEEATYLPMVSMLTLGVMLLFQVIIQEELMMKVSLLERKVMNYGLNSFHGRT